MKLNNLILFLVVQCIFPIVGYSAVIFSDDFESESSSWTCDQGELEKWSEGYGYCESTPGFGYEWKMGAGHDSGNAVYSWKKSGVPNGYRGESARWLTGSELYTEVYHRWYMKVPTSANYNKALDGGLKFWRYMLRENGHETPPEMYLDVSGSTFAGGNLVISINGNMYQTLTPVSDFNDNTWHCHELRIKLSSDGASDGLVQYWLDGTLKKTLSNLNFGAVTNKRVHRVGVGVGNVSQSDWYQTSWSAIAFDDVVVSTTYVGPIAGEPTITRGGRLSGSLSGGGVMR